MNRILSLAGVCLAAVSGLSIVSAAQAQDAPGEPVFSVQRSSSSQVSAAAWAFNAGDYERAERLGRASLRNPARLSAPRRSIAYANWCAALSMTDQHAEAIAACEEAVSLQPANWRAHLNHAGALHRAGQADEARAALAEARRLAPSEDAVIRAAEILDSRSLASAG
ncbi:tetratricopeptide repeat protein [Hyphobacterium marinum]|uniref:Tetratricopeptide repeat protein n=1 Tax=Hyphobacterium marinum TaxID=3116574 RepID=A0ABU7M004_9PROT|nr:tetratricopeptide repeat protein [Hyphobacterium sp. Y6023]MEE2567129.1 tetratricopeptide repeat protein [Hyphobacterium sp. Y6023]